MDWGSLIGSVMMLAFVTLTLQLLWRVLLGLLVFGPPSYGGVIIRQFVGVQAGNVLLGFVSAIVAAGLLSELVYASLRTFGLLVARVTHRASINGPVWLVVRSRANRRRAYRPRS